MVSVKKVIRRTRVRDLLLEYPGLIDNCRLWDCGYGEAMKRMDADNLTGYLGGVELN